MADKVEINTGTPAQVAFELWKYMRSNLPENSNGIDAQLDLFRSCLEAAKGVGPIRTRSQ